MCIGSDRCFVDPRRFEHVHVDQHVVVHDQCLVGLDEADATHVGGQVVDLVHLSGRFEARIPTAQVQALEGMRPRGLELRSSFTSTPRTQ